jgi:hypothetical protein
MKKKNIILVSIAAALATAATVFFIKNKKDGQQGRPPKNAPQLKVENPGEQSEFTTTASESDLG